MTSHDNISSLLSELYELEPSLREKEDAIKKIITSMTKNRPDVVIDENFRSELRKKIMQSIDTKKAKEFSFFQWIVPVAGLAALCLIVWVWMRLDKPTEGAQPLLAFNQSIESVGKNAFWTIQAQGDATWAQTPIADTRELSMATTSRPQSGGGWSEGANAKIAWDMMIYPIDMKTYRYSYTGELSLPSEWLPVYKKSAVPFSSTDTRNFLNNLRIENFDINAFSNLGISNISLVEDREYGYMISLDFTNGWLSMYQNYTNWPQMYENYQPLSAADTPSDEVMIAAAQAFIQKYGIDVSSYGTPIIDSSWRLWAARSAYIPEMYSVIYPLMVDGKRVVQEGGAYQGISLNYDARTKRIIGMNGIQKVSLQKSEYDIISKENIEKMIENGGRYITNNIPADADIVTLTLGDPTLEYVQIYGEWKNGKSEEYYVPAYVFPVENRPEESYISNTVIVPLVGDFMEETDYIKPMPVEPMPYYAEPTIDAAVKEDV